MDKQLLFESKKIFYRVYGEGNPVLLVHGFGETGDVWKNQIAFLQDQCLLIVPDLPGSGESELIDDMSMEGMAEVQKTILDTEVPDAPASGTVVIGHSMGGYIVLAFAAKYRQYLRAFGLFQSTAYADNEEKKTARQKGIEFTKEHGAFAFLKNAVPKLFSPITKAENQALIDEFLESLNNFSSESLVYYYESMMRRPDRTEVLTNTPIPVLFVMGKYDTAIPPEDGLKLGKLPEKAYIHMLAKSGHMGMMEEADRSNEILETFIKDAWAF